MEALLSRYTPSQQKIISEYWETIRFTRKTCQVSDGIQKKEMEYWAKFVPTLVIQALQIHIDKYPSIRESYTRGILRNLKGGSESGDQRQTDYSQNIAEHGGKSTAGKRDTRAEEAFRRKLGI